MLDNIHDVQVSQTSRFTLGGQVVPAIIVRYFVGDHGPFEDQYDAAEATPERIRQGYVQRVMLLHAAGVALPAPPQETAPGSGEFRVTGTPGASTGVPPAPPRITVTPEGTARVLPAPPKPGTPSRF